MDDGISHLADWLDKLQEDSFDSTKNIRLEAQLDISWANLVDSQKDGEQSEAKEFIAIDQLNVGLVLVRGGARIPLGLPLVLEEAKVFQLVEYVQI